jgi:hypothetical protein
MNLLSPCEWVEFGDEPSRHTHHDRSLEPLLIWFHSLIPESPRWLVSKDRYDEALEVLIKYHGEGDRDSVLVQAEMAQIQSTIKIELDNSRQSWMDMLRTSGMRRRVIIASFLGWFTQMSGNTLIS